MGSKQCWLYWSINLFLYHMFNWASQTLKIALLSSGLGASTFRFCMQVVQKKFQRMSKMSKCQWLTSWTGYKIIKYMPGTPLIIPYQEFCISSMGPAHSYWIYMLTGPYSLFRNWLIGNNSSYWLVHILLLGTTILEINYISKLLSSSLCKTLKTQTNKNLVC